MMIKWYFYIIGFYLTKINYASKYETKLFEDLFLKNDSYPSSVRPVLNKSMPVVVKLNIAFVQVVQLNDRDQSLTSNVWIRQWWKNELLTWQPEDYGGVTEITVDKKWIWKPDLVLYNSVEGSLNGQLDQYKTRVTIRHDGTNAWYIPAIIVSGCSINIRYFPFDVQTCILQFGSWSFSSPEMDLQSTRDDIDISFYQESSDFLMAETKAERNSVKYSCCPHNIIDITFSVTLHRQPGYYVFNVIIPTLVLTLFAAFVFAFPVTTGERMGLAIQCFLTISILMMMVSDLIPIDSNVTPLLGSFMLTCMCSITFSIVMNAVCFNLDRLVSVPTWLHNLMFNKVAPAVMMGSCWQSIKQSGKLKPSSLCKGMFAASIQKQQKESSDFLGNLARLKEFQRYSSTLEMKFFDLIPPDKTSLDNYGKFHESQLKPRKNNKASQNVLTQTEFDVLNIRALLNRTIHEVDAENTSEFWRAFSQTIDRCLLLIFSSTYICVSIAIFLQVPSENF